MGALTDLADLADLPWIPVPPAWQIDWPQIDAACPWLAPLAATPQDPRHHAEGNVLIHTRMVAEALVALTDWQSLPAADRALLFVAALLHDIGKPGTTRLAADGTISAPHHARLGAGLTRTMIWNGDLGLDLPFATREALVALVRLHGLPIWFLSRDQFEQAIIIASLSSRLDLVALLAEADARGRICYDQQDLLDRITMFREWCTEHGCLSAPFPFPNDHARVRYCRGWQDDPYYAAFDTSWGEVTLLSGLPGAGKDTWVHQHHGDQAVISLDALRHTLGVEPEDAQAPVIEAAKQQARELLRQQRPFIWNATNLTRHLRDPLGDLILNYHARLRIIYFDVPPQIAIERNHRRPHPVPDLVIRRLAARIEIPDLREAHSLHMVTTE
ncbi:MAG: AAA family ATPase [Roseiflexaceae bacterium]